MKKLDYTVQFVTPAFLGNAEQDAQWRTPPFKTMLRQWWRILKAKEARFDSDLLRQREAVVFGSALDNDATQSLVRLKLSKWSAGTLKTWGNPDLTVEHCEVHKKGGVGSQLYLGYGPLKYSQGTALKSNAAIQEGDKAEFSLVIPDGFDTEFSTVMQLANCFATLGGRARNGWGSLMFTPKGTLKSLDTPDSKLIESLSAPLNECMKHDWPTAIGRDEKGLFLWTGKQPHDTWGGAMKEVATVKIAIRTQFKFNGGKGGPLDERHILSYPVTNHDTRSFDRNARLPNQLRFKVTTVDGIYKVTAFHFPVRTPGVVGKSFSIDQQILIWKQVHQKMDALMMRAKL